MYLYDSDGSRKVASVSGNDDVLRQVAKEIESQLRRAMLNWMQYGKGRDRVVELQRRYAQYNGRLHTELLHGPTRRALAA